MRGSVDMTEKTALSYEKVPLPYSPDRFCAKSATARYAVGAHVCSAHPWGPGGTGIFLPGREEASGPRVGVSTRIVFYWARVRARIGCTNTPVYVYVRDNNDETTVRTRGI